VLQRNRVNVLMHHYIRVTAEHDSIQCRLQHYTQERKCGNVGGKESVDVERCPRIVAGIQTGIQILVMPSLTGTAKRDLTVLLPNSYSVRHDLPASDQPILLVWVRLCVLLNLFFRCVLENEESSGYWITESPGHD
jgi:hypothetical protein